MYSDSRFIIIAGTARNVGKTTLACGIINKLSENRVLVGLKFISLKKGSSYKHVHHKKITSFAIYEETNLLGTKDSSKMLQAGANRSYLIVSQEEFIDQALSAFSKLINNGDIIVAESASLRNFINPKFFIILDNKSIQDRKPYINALVPYANYNLNSDTDEMFQGFLSKFSY